MVWKAGVVAMSCWITCLASSSSNFDAISLYVAWRVALLVSPSRPLVSRVSRSSMYIVEFVND
eukprot:5619976-Ditylum_brightwellii.AAC.1